MIYNKFGEKHISREGDVLFVSATRKNQLLLQIGRIKNIIKEEK